MIGCDWWRELHITRNPPPPLRVIGSSHAPPWNFQKPPPHAPNGRGSDANFLALLLLQGTKRPGGPRCRSPVGWRGRLACSHACTGTVGAQQMLARLCIWGRHSHARLPVPRPARLPSTPIHSHPLTSSSSIPSSFSSDPANTTFVHLDRNRPRRKQSTLPRKQLASSFLSSSFSLHPQVLHLLPVTCLSQVLSCEHTNCTFQARGRCRSHHSSFNPALTPLSPSLPQQRAILCN